MSASPHPGPLQRYPRRRRVAGGLHYWRDVDLPGLGRRSDIYVWLPPGYARSRARYPVIYLHDGGNLFDRKTAFIGVTWSADRALMALHEQGIDVIAVGIPCSPDRRIEEYTPALSESVRTVQPGLGEPAGDTYVSFLTDHLKPWVDAALRTRPEREHTLIAGSSMGAVISLHAWVRRPDVFSGIGAFSPALWVPGESQLRDLETALASPHPPSRFYLDVGGHEEPDNPAAQAAYQQDCEQVVHAARGAQVPVRYVYDSAAFHTESAWAERLPSALAWLLSGYAVQRPGGAPTGLLDRLRSAVGRLRRS